MKRPYSALGGAFEYLNDDCGYEQWSQYLIDGLAALGVKIGARGADVGCGNGYFTRAFNKHGFNAVGVDISPEMLSAAMQSALREGVRTEFLLGDITKLNLNFKCDFITAVNDCLNYVPQGELLKTFKRVAKNLKKGGAFIFDISTSHKLKRVIGDNVFSEDRGDYAYVWFNCLKADRVDMDITLFTRRPDGLYERSDEAQTQYIHEKADVVAALADAGFETKCEGHLGGSEELRINFLCKKTS